MNKYLLFLSFFLLPLLAIPAGAQGGSDGDDMVLMLLANRHFDATPSELEEAAGGAAQLIDRLLELRKLEFPPYVSVRAERLLLSYAGEERVKQALIEDLRDPQLAGLARVIVLNLGEAPVQARLGLAREALLRTSRDPSFARYTDVFSEGEDTELKRLVTEFTE